MLLLVKNFLVKKKFEMVRCRDETASSFVAKVWVEVFEYFKALPYAEYAVWPAMTNYL
jgi:hypothetical protein